MTRRPTPADDALEAPALIVARALVAWKARLLPTDSWRERMARRIYIPILARLDHKMPVIAMDDPEAHVEIIRNQAFAALPAGARILVIKLDHLGDLVVGLRALEKLRAAFPQASLTLVCGPWGRAWAERLGWFDAVVPFSFFPARGADWQGPTEAIYDAYRALDLGPFDLAIDLRHDGDTRKLLALTDTRFRAGFYAPPLYEGEILDIGLPDTEHVSPERGTGMPLHAQARLTLLADAVIAAFAPPPPHPARHLVGERAELPDVGGGPVIVVGLGVGAPIRAWSLDRTAEVCQRLIDRHDATVALIGGPDDRAAGAQVAAVLPAGRVADLTGRLDLGAVPALIERAMLYIGGDTGLTHLAAAIGVPTVVIYPGISALEVWRPVGARVVVVAGRTKCAPCHLTLPSQCPFGVACLDVVKTADVLAAAESLIGACGAGSSGVVSEASLLLSAAETGR